MNCGSLHAAHLGFQVAHGLWDDYPYLNFDWCAARMQNPTIGSPKLPPSQRSFTAVCCFGPFSGCLLLRLGTTTSTTLIERALVRNSTTRAATTVTNGWRHEIALAPDSTNIHSNLGGTTIATFPPSFEAFYSLFRSLLTRISSTGIGPHSGKR